MNWFDQLRMRTRGLPHDIENRVLRWLQLPSPSKKWLLKDMEFVVVDTETSGLNPRRDALLSIGAVRVRACRLLLDESFDRHLKQATPSSAQNILIHGISGTQQLHGDDPVNVLTEFLEFAGKAELVGFHAEFDRLVLDRALRNLLGVSLPQAWIDLAQLLPQQFERRDYKTLDDWLQHFGVEAPVRHNALGDAAATASLLLIALQRMLARGTTALGELRQLGRPADELPSN